MSEAEEKAQQGNFEKEILLKATKLLNNSLGIVEKGETTYKTISSASSASYEDEFMRCDLESRQEDLEIKRQRKKKRNQLSWWVLGTAVVWLIFSGVIITYIGLGVLKFSDYSVISFILGSLAEVFGLWKIALQYFFSDK